MAFSFGFSGDDIDESMDLGDTNSVVSSNEQPSQPIKDVTYPEEYTPKIHTLESLLRSSVGTRMSYSYVQVPRIDKSTEYLSIVRRDLFDVKHQLMLMDDLSETEEILMGLTNEDLKVAQYEGGLKSWECTFDLVSYMTTQKGDHILSSSDTIELGCGTGIPSLYILQQRLLKEKANQSDEALTLYMADYNESVLRLVTAPNLLFTWLETLDVEDRFAMLLKTSDPSTAIAEPRAGEAEITNALVDEFLKALESRNIHIKLVSGGWSQQFVDLVKADHGNKPFQSILASETVYSLDTLPVFTKVLLEFMEENYSTALVAAKQVYFGVGGGILEFEQALDKENAKHGIVYTTGQGVLRSIVEVKR